MDKLVRCAGLSLLGFFLCGCGSTSVTSVSPGQVEATLNPQVARYTISVPAGAAVTIQFGPTTSYGLKTWTQTAPANGGEVNIYVAGMKANTAYHMQALVQLADGTRVMDGDHVFTAGAPLGTIPPLTTSTPAGLTPQSGVELLDLVTPSYTQVLATDLSGNVVWSYAYKGTGTELPEPVKLLRNGDFLVAISPSVNTQGAFAPNDINQLREVDLAGITVRGMSVDDLNAKLAYGGFDLNVYTMHHDVTVLPNGHWIILVNSLKLFTDLPGYPGQVNVLGDALIDLDETWRPVWVWNSFDHLDVNRHPMNFPDWTHSNAIVYSPDDGNLLVSMRHQNWILKIDYEDGRGSGDVLWRLGEGGDFTLQGGVDPTDWFYAQHGPSFASPNTSGNFSLALFDNGNDREFPTGVTCGATGAPPCFYSTAMVMQIDEVTKLATIQFNDDPIGYSVFGGNAEVLANGDLEFDMCDISQAPDLAVVYEVTQESQPQIVWQMNLSNDYAYRAFRLPSLYPGVQW
jgi:arylsulfate sulfotransferase